MKERKKEKARTKKVTLFSSLLTTHFDVIIRHSPEKNNANSDASI